MRRSYKFRIYPTKSQITLLNNTLEQCRWVYNQTINLRKTTWENREETISLYETHKVLTQWKKENPSLQIVYAQVLQNVQMRVDLAYKNFFRRIKAGQKPGYPRFKGNGRYNSFTYPQHNNGFKVEENQTSFYKIGKIKTKFHRKINGKILTATIVKRSSGKWFISFSTEIDNIPLPCSFSAVGIDVGLTTFATLSNSEIINNPRFFKKEAKELARVQRNNKGKVVSKIHERIANKRTNFAHQESRKIVQRFGRIAVEKLDIKGMTRNNFRPINRSITDVAWYQFISFLAYKAEEAGRQFVMVNPAYTSQRCSRCSQIVVKSLSDRIHNCPICSLSIDRDLNASINILALGLQSMGSIPKSPPSGTITLP